MDQREVAKTTETVIYTGLKTAAKIYLILFALILFGIPLLFGLGAALLQAF